MPISIPPHCHSIPSALRGSFSRRAHLRLAKLIHKGTLPRTPQTYSVLVILIDGSVWDLRGDGDSLQWKGRRFVTCYSPSPLPRNFQFHLLMRWDSWQISDIASS